MNRSMSSENSKNSIENRPIQSTRTSEGTLLYKIYDGDFHSNSGFLFVNTLLHLPNKTLRRNVKRQINTIAHGDTVVIEYGGNVCDYDWPAISVCPGGEHKPKTSVKDFRLFYDAVLAQVYQAGGVPVLLTIPAVRSQQLVNNVCQGLNKEGIMRWIGGEAEFIKERIEPYNEAIREIAAEYQTPVIDITHLLDERENADDYYEADGIHPNEAGRALITERIRQFYF
ncbi:MAG: SGNH/GDSL hydrolase family protein [Bacteroidales bacterium]|nr:SGNH/GDSL hydrolase family protein [Bacteroidales bacterium]